MSRFHFNVHDGFTRPDPKGKDLPDLKAVRREAIRLAGRILEEDADRVSLGEVWYMEVTNDQGEVVFQLDFSGQAICRRASIAAKEKLALLVGRFL